MSLIHKNHSIILLILTLNIVSSAFAQEKKGGL
jgi:hypothetical protein